MARFIWVVSGTVILTVLATPVSAQDFKPDDRYQEQAKVTEEPEVQVVSEAVAEEKTGPIWGLTTSGNIGHFSSNPLKGFVGRITNRNVCMVDGRTFDLGLAYGEPQKSFWRFTFAGMFINNGSFTSYECKNCGVEVTAVSDGMRILGGGVERVFRIGLNGWKIQPMAGIHAGLGRVTGRAYRYLSLPGGPTTRIEYVGANQLFGSGFFPIIGNDLGFVGNLGSQFTYGVTVFGIEYPGVYYGRIQLTYWPKQ